MNEDTLLEVVDINNYLWEGSLTTRSVNKWLNNFTGECKTANVEQDVALTLLRNFIYYGENEIKYLCKAAFSLLKRHSLIQNPQSLFTQEGNRKSQLFIDNCIFSYVGGASESGAMLSYPFRQENPIFTRRYLEPPAFLTDDITDEQLANSNLVFIDDFIGTGSTVCTFWNTRVAKIRARCKSIKVIWLSLVATKSAIDTIKSHTGIDVICPQVLDETTRAFSDTSVAFPIHTERAVAKSICSHYGSQLVDDMDALGFGDSQLLIAFHHNTPDNTLPIIWSENSTDFKKWHPLFRRKLKS